MDVDRLLAIGESIHRDFSSLEDRVLADIAKSSARGNHKDLMFATAYTMGRFGHKIIWDAYDDYVYLGDPAKHRTVADALSVLPGTRMTSTRDGDDPLFEAMERHKNRIKAGKAALKTLFKAEALPVYHNQSTGPAKTKDWE